MIFERALQRAKSKRRTAAWEGALELSRFHLAEFPESWQDFLQIAIRLADHRRFERAVASIGPRIHEIGIPLLSSIEGDDRAPLVRILGGALGAEAFEFCYAFKKESPLIWGAALEVIADRFPEQAEPLLLEEVSSSKVRRTQKCFAVALARCATPLTIALLRDNDLSDDACLFEEFSVMSAERFDRYLDFAEIAVDDSTQTSKLCWPLGQKCFLQSILHIRSERVDNLLEKLTDIDAPQLQRAAICELARRGSARGIRLVRERCLTDRMIAEVAVDVAFSLGTSEPFDWFAKIFLFANPDDVESVNHVIRKRVLERLPNCRDARWAELSCQIASRDPNMAGQIRLQMTAEAVRELRGKLLSPSDIERVKAVVRLGELKDVVVLPWIGSRIESDDPISREEYFGFIEAVRQLGSPDGVILIKRLVKRCGLVGFAVTFAEETIELLDDS